MYDVDLGVDVVEGWNLVGVAINYDATTVGAERTLATGYVKNEANTAGTNGGSVAVLDMSIANTHPNVGMFFDSASFSGCVGGSLTGTAIPYASSNPLTGIVYSMEMFDSAIGAAGIFADSSTSCTGYCELCSGTGTCFN